MNRILIKVFFFILISGILSPSIIRAHEKTLTVYTGIGGDFELTSHFGSRLKIQDYRGKIVLLNFGYTHCPDVCPTTLSYLKLLIDKLGDHRHEVQTLFITFDPSRDTPEHLNQYLSYFHASFIGLTGASEEIDKVAQLYQAKYIKQESKSAAGYSFAHTDLIYILDEYGRIRSMYRSKDPVEDVLHNIRELIESKKNAEALGIWKKDKETSTVKVKFGEITKYIDPKEWCFAHGVPHPLLHSSTKDE